MIMILASIAMIRNNKVVQIEEEQLISYNYSMIILEGAVVGVLTGIVGAGGWFFNYSCIGVICQVVHEKSGSYLSFNHRY